jgi:hypothetical protein
MASDRREMSIDAREGDLTGVDLFKTSQLRLGNDVSAKAMFDDIRIMSSMTCQSNSRRDSFITSTPSNIRFITKNVESLRPPEMRTLWNV